MDYIQLAVDKTKEGIDQNIGGPFGATIVRGDEIIAVVGNTMMRDTDITAHAEIVAIREASKSLHNGFIRLCHLRYLRTMSNVCGRYYLVGY